MGNRKTILLVPEDEVVGHKGVVGVVFKIEDGSQIEMTKDEFKEWIEQLFTKEVKRRLPKALEEAVPKALKEVLEEAKKENEGSLGGIRTWQSI